MKIENDPIEEFLDLICVEGMSETGRAVCLGCVAIVTGMFLAVIVSFISVTPHMLWTLNNLPTPPQVPCQAK